MGWVGPYFFPVWGWGWLEVRAGRRSTAIAFWFRDGAQMGARQAWHKWVPAEDGWQYQGYTWW